MRQSLQIALGSDGDELPSNFSQNRAFRNTIEARLNRRDLLIGGLSGAVATVFGGLPHPSAARGARPDAGLLGFQPVPVSVEDRIVVPSRYRVQVLLPWGEPMLGTMPPFDTANSGEEQAMQIGSHHDGLHFFPIDGSSQDGLFVMNHEYVEPRLMHASAAGKQLGPNGYVLTDRKRNADEVLREINAHGVSVTRIRRQADGRWIAVADPCNRRITGQTAMEISGPVRGSARERPPRCVRLSPPVLGPARHLLGRGQPQRWPLRRRPTQWISAPFIRPGTGRSLHSIVLSGDGAMAGAQSVALALRSKVAAICK